jgi:hypothetical protein
MWPTIGWMAGTVWIALQPVPMTATRLPVRSTSWRHRAVWKAGPSNCSSPGIGGTDGTDSWPQAVTSTSASCVPAVVSTTQRLRSASHSAPVTSVLVRTRSKTPWRRATSST